MFNFSKIKCLTALFSFYVKDCNNSTNFFSKFVARLGLDIIIVNLCKSNYELFRQIQLCVDEEKHNVKINVMIVFHRFPFTTKCFFWKFLKLAFS